MKYMTIFFINNLLYLILKSMTIKEIKEVTILHKNDKELYVLLNTKKKKLKINLIKYINNLNNTDVENNIIKKKKKNINPKDIKILITDTIELNKLEKGLIYEIPLKEYI